MENQNSWYCTLVLNVVMILGAFSIGHPFTCFNPVAPVIQEIYNQTYFVRHGEPIPEDTWSLLFSFTMSIVFIGAFISSLVVKPLLARFTKIRLLVGSHIINLIGCVIIAIGTYRYGSYEAFIIGRFVNGVFMGLGLGINGVWIGEICVAQKRTFYAGLLGTWYLIGALYGILMGWSKVFGTSGLWIGVIVTGMLPSVIFLLCAHWIPETPLQIIRSKGRESAKHILKRLRTEHGDALQSEMQSLTGDNNEMLKEGNVQSTETAGFSEIMKTRQYRKHFFSVVIIFTNITACGLSNILFFSDAIFLSAGLDPEIVTVGTIVVFIIGIITSFCTLFAIGKIDPKSTELIGIAATILGDVLMTLSLATKDTISAMSAISVVGTCIFFAGFSLCNMSAYMLVTNLFIERTSVVCMAFATMGFWFFAWLVGFTSPYLDVAAGPYAFMIWMAISIAVGLYVIFFVPKVSGRSEEEIQKFYKK